MACVRFLGDHLGIDRSRYFDADVSKVDLVRLGQRTLAQLLSWRQNLPEALDLDPDCATPPERAPHILILQ